MRVPLLLAALLLLPLAAGAAPVARGDLIVTLREAAVADAAGLPLLSVIPGFVMLDATAADHARLSRDPRIERLDWAVPLELHALALPASAHASLTRAAPSQGRDDGAGVTVAVVDSGIDATHPDLLGRVRENVRLEAGAFVPAAGDADGHGTHVAGIVGARHERYGGVAPGVELVGIDISERFTTASAILAYDWLYTHREEHGIRVVVNAWGRVGQGEAYDPKDPELRAIDRIVAAGVVVLFSASNHGPGAGTLSVEAMDPHVITVGATDAAGQLAAYSSRGPVNGDASWTKPDVVAPGDAVAGPRSARSLLREGDPDPLHTVYSGTSQAVPHVGGIVARMLQADPDLAPHEVARILRETAIDLGEPGIDSATGWGLVDARDAILTARGQQADRANVLVRGGADTQRDAADLASTSSRSLLDVLSRPQVVWETPVAVKIGATRLAASAQATGARDVSVELVKDGRVSRASVVEDPEPGVWTLRVRATLPLATRVETTATATMPSVPERALQMDGRNTAAAPPAEASANGGSPLAQALGGEEAAFDLTVLLGSAVVGALVAAAMMPAVRARSPKE